ncbi:MAG TPA: amidohydrolase, partial [Novosphingobium sp.]|nr:amidohydrolase [Novosphingobium sp.]
RRTQVIDLDGAFALPAFADGHTHFLKGAVALSQPDLLQARSQAEFTALVAAAVRKAPGQWLLGGAWDEQRMGGQLPTRAWLDAVSPDTPIALPRTDLHSLLLNSVALRLAGITRDTPDPDGGMILRDAQGEPTGVLKDNAKALVLRIIPAPSEAETDAALRAGIAHGLSKGFAQIHNPEIDWTVLPALRRLRAAGETDLRFYCFVPIHDWARLVEIIKADGRGDDWVRWGGVKALADGSLGARTAAFFGDYADAPGQKGLWVTPPDELRELVRAADAHGLHVATHAIGDRANATVLDIYAEVARAHGPRDRRFRIEHAQHMRLADIPRFRAQNVIASVQPFHAIDDGRWAVKRIGEARLAGTYAFRSFFEAGVKMAFGSDWPVAPLDPFVGIAAAVLRETIDGANPHGWQPQQRVSVEQALKAYTQGNAYAAFMDDRAGLLAPGYYADITVLDRDLTAVRPEEILATKVLKTIVNGRLRYEG